MKLIFHTLTISDREAVQAVSLHAGRRNCNYNFANLLGWQFWFQTEVCVLEDAVVLRYSFKGKHEYMVCTARDLPLELIEALREDSQGDLTIRGLEDSQVEALQATHHSRFTIETEPVSNQYDYIYCR
ncbi:MAG: hypothetical protein II087_07675, partial [Muribaculaceae bacterium]|nr:hypothetical protein [Muribaculaceae bacterium]